jgi:peroxiredoxin
MAKTPSNMVPLNQKAPDFQLKDVVTEKVLSLNELKEAKLGVVVMFICNHCPFVIHIQDKLLEVAREYQKKGIQFIAINSNDVTKYPDDSPEKMKKIAESKNYPFPYLFDEDQTVAKAYNAACTPDFFLYDENLNLVYRGRFCGATPGNEVKITGNDLKNAMNLLLDKKGPLENQLPSMGCNIKWKF